MSSRFLRAVVLLTAIAAGAPPVVAQTAGDSTLRQLRNTLAEALLHRCDSILAASGADSVPVAIFVTSGRVDGALPVGRPSLISTAIATAFSPPRPLSLSVFTGPAQMRALRRLVSDSTSELRAPVVIGVYRFTATKAKAVAHLETVRETLIPGFDSAAMNAIQSAAIIKEVTELPGGEDSMRVEVRFSNDSMPGSFRMLSGVFPRLPVVDAVPLRDNPAAAFPADESPFSTTREVVLRFVVDPNGLPAFRTVEVVRASSANLLRSALTILPEHHFTPASVHGCPVAQVVYYPFSFVLPEPGNPPPRH